MKKQKIIAFMLLVLMLFGISTIVPTIYDDPNYGKYQIPEGEEIVYIENGWLQTGVDTTQDGEPDVSILISPKQQNHMGIPAMTVGKAAIVLFSKEQHGGCEFLQLWWIDSNALKENRI